MPSSGLLSSAGIRHTHNAHTYMQALNLFLIKWNSNMKYACLSSKSKDSFHTRSHLQSKHGKHSVALGLVTHACFPSIQEAEQENQDTKACLSYTVSSRRAGLHDYET